MKRIGLFYIISTVCIIFSCSNDDDSAQANDIIIGEWIAIQQYESDILVDLPIHLQCIYTTFAADNNTFSDLIPSNNLPTECSTLNFVFGITWTNLGNNQYGIGFPNEQGQIHVFYKEGENLIQEKSNGTTKIVYESYE